MNTLRLILCATLVVVSHADLISDLMGQNFTVLSPGQNGYSAASTACE